MSGPYGLPGSGRLLSSPWENGRPQPDRGLQPRREAVAWEIQDRGEGVPVAWGPWCLCPLPIEQPSSGGEPCSLQELAGEAAAVSDLACTAAVVIRRF